MMKLANIDIFESIDNNSNKDMSNMSVFNDSKYNHGYDYKKDEYYKYNYEKFSDPLSYDGKRYYNLEYDPDDWDYSAAYKDACDPVIDVPIHSPYYSRMLAKEAKISLSHMKPVWENRVAKPLIRELKKINNIYNRIQGVNGYEAGPLSFKEFVRFGRACRDMLAFVDRNLHNDIISSCSWVEGDYGSYEFDGVDWEERLKLLKAYSTDREEWKKSRDDNGKA